MNVRKPLACLPLFAILILIACQPTEQTETDQQAYYRELETLQSIYADARESKNAYLIDQIEAEAKKKLKTMRDLVNWAATIESVSDGSINNAVNNTYTVTAEYKEITLYIDIPKDVVGADIQQFTNGEKIIFSGTALHERSFTIDGAIAEPELTVYADVITFPRTGYTYHAPPPTVVNFTGE